MATPDEQHAAPVLTRLRAYVADWVKQDIITREQGEAILAHQGISRRPRAVFLRAIYSRLVTVLATLGAIMVGVGIILFVGSNWQEIPRFSKLALILATIVVSYLAGYWLKYRSNFPRVGGAILFLGTIAYGAGVFLVAQMYHINASDPNLLYMWFLGVVPFAYLTRSRLILILAIILALTALGQKTEVWVDMTDNILLYMAMYLSLGGAGYALALAHGRSATMRIFARPYMLFGLLVLLGSLYSLTFSQPFDDALNSARYIGGQWVVARAGPAPIGFLMHTGIISAIAVASVATSLVTVARAKAPWGPLPYQAAVVLAAIGGSYLATFFPFSQPWPYVVIFQGALLAVVVSGTMQGLLARAQAAGQAARRLRLLSRPTTLLVLAGAGFLMAEWAKAAGWAGFDRDALALSSLYILVLGCSAYALAIWHSRLTGTSLYSHPLFVMGAFAVLVALYVLSFQGAYDLYRPTSRLWAPALPPGAFLAGAFLTAALGISLAVGSVIRVGPTKLSPGTLPYELIGIPLLIGAAGALIFLPFSQSWPYVAIFNSLLFAAMVGAILLGFFNRRTMLVNAGILVFAVGVMTRYFDLLGGMLQTGFLFIGAGILLLGGGFALERFRRRLVPRVRLTEVPHEP